MIDLPLAKDLFSATGGHSRAKKTLWIFGETASAHLGIPPASGLLRDTVSMVFNTIGRPNEILLDCGRASQDPAFRKADGKTIENWEVRSMKQDPEVAFEYIRLLEHFSTDEDTRMRLAPLVGELSQLRQRLADVGICPPTADLLQRSPRDLCGEIAHVDPTALPDEIRRGRDLAVILHSIEQARSCVSRLHVLALLEFNDRARSLVQSNWRSSYYEHLVRRGVFDSDCQIVSFNCDTALDESLFRSFGGTWTYDAIDVAGINGLPAVLQKETDLKLIKPHGSLNMLPCPACGKTHIQWFRRFVAVSAEQPVTISCKCPCCHSRTGPDREQDAGVILPTLYDQRQIDESKDAIRRAFSWSEQILSIGYPFPIDDTQLFQCMTDGLQANTHPQVDLWLVSAGQTKTKTKRKRKTLRDRLLSSDQFSILRDNRYRVRGADLGEFETEFNEA